LGEGKGVAVILNTLENGGVGIVQETIEKEYHILIINRIITKTGVYCFW